MAVDGIDEFYDVLVPFSAARWTRPLPTGSLHLHRTDGDGEWLVRAVDGAVVMTREHAKGDVALRGPASDLFAFVWNRGRSDAVTTFGDDAVADEWAALAP
jgi:predicted lipid carrier protein YhbT